jgi:hypothetical protein
MRRLLIRTALTVLGIVGGLFSYFVCQGMFSGYPRYHTGLLGFIAMMVIAATGGVAWLIDERRIRDDS